jgi:hypothetical protein
MQKYLLAAGTLVTVVACGGYGYQTNTDTTMTTGAPMITTGPQAGQPELSRTYGDLSARLAKQVCARELRCDRRQDASECEGATIVKARQELIGWDCSPAETRAAIEQCLAGIDETHCDVDLVSPGKNICRQTLACKRSDSNISTGRAHAFMRSARP